MTSQLDLHNKVSLTKKTYRLGGTAMVYEGILAVDRAGRTAKVAVKMLNSDSQAARDASISQALNSAAPTWSQLNHPNVARFYGLDRDFGFNGIPAIVVDYYERGNILNYLQKKYGPDVNNAARNQEALRLMVEVAQGLKYLHSHGHGFVHGDIRGANIMVDDQGHARITDAGLIFAMPSNEIPYLEAVRPPGRCRWTSPELLERVMQAPVQGSLASPPGYSTASDVYAFGMTLVEVFSGMPPFSPELVTGAGNMKPKTQSDIEMLLVSTKGMRPLLPKFVADHHVLRSLVPRCWDAKPTTRPTMDQVCRSLASVGSSGA